MPEPARLSPVVTLPTEGTAYNSIGQTNVLKLSARSTGGTHALFEIIVPPSNGTPPHVHAREDETFYVLEGTVRFVIGEDIIDAAPCTTIFAPRGQEHQFLNFSDKDARMLVLGTPGQNLVSFFEELDKVSADASGDQVVATCEKYGITIIETDER